MAGRFPAQCLCLTVDGFRCRNRPREGSTFCHVHQNCANLAERQLGDYTDEEIAQWSAAEDRRWEETMRKQQEAFRERAMFSEEERYHLEHIDLRPYIPHGYTCGYAELLPEGMHCNEECPITMIPLDETNTAAFVCQGDTKVPTVLCYNMYGLFYSFMRLRDSTQLPFLPDNRVTVLLPDRIRLGIRVLKALISGRPGDEDLDYAELISRELGGGLEKKLKAYQKALRYYE